ncbi:MAG TPA: helix-turn-helix transcriptional regulator [Sphingobium sp.]|uniref:AraC family transcriptional regulator n=1 Tax=Sphingobium sp. TaxID=1912891 RepID=UPI002ED48B59
MRSLTPEETIKALDTYGLTTPRGIGFAFADRAQNTLYDWHTHDYHQLIHATAGASWIETQQGRHVLPVGRAAWIPAHTPHRTLIAHADGASLYFAPDTLPDTSGRIRILVAPPVMREMILHAMRWPLGAAEDDPVAASFFQTLALLCAEWLESELPLFLPRADHPAIVRAMDYASADPAAANQRDAVAAARLSERTFRRLFEREAGMGWQAWLAQLRILHAMGELIDGGRVTDVAANVGYASLSAFAKAFAQLTGESPSSFRQRNRK